MAEKYTVLTLRSQNGNDLKFASGDSGQVAMTKLVNHLHGGLNGSHTVRSLAVRDAGVAASGTVTISSGSGAITITINGITAGSETWATSDAATATALAVDINASSNALVANHVTASAAGGVVTITAVSKGIVGNTITTAASGTGATASGARLTGGTNDSTLTFTL